MAITNILNIFIPRFVWQRSKAIVLSKTGPVTKNLAQKRAKKIDYFQTEKWPAKSFIM